VQEYARWREQRLQFRHRFYSQAVEPGLLSILTPVWNGSPTGYLKELAQSLAAQNEGDGSEWVILANGVTNRPLLAYLEELSRYRWVKLCRTETNVGITRGLRLCLEKASGRYVLPVDGDDWLYPDALRVVTWGIVNAGYPPLLYTDEDKIIGRNRFYQPYLKPSWDPVLLLNSAYIAHLGVIDREKALALGAYTDSTAEASPDWDLFLRFLAAGIGAVHIPEVVYSWRVHAESTADDAASKPYVHASQKAVLQRYLDSRPDGASFGIRNSPLLAGGAHWHFVSAQKRDLPIHTVLLTLERAKESACSILDVAREAAGRDAFLHFRSEDLKLDESDWISEVATLWQLYPDAVMIGGRIRNSQGVITEAGRYFGICGFCGCPHRGRPATDPGYFTHIWKQRCVSAVTTQLSVVNARFLVDVAQRIPQEASLAFLGAWAGAQALREKKRVLYTPFLSGVSDLDWDALVPADEHQIFAQENAGLLFPDYRFYSRGLSTARGFEFGNPEYSPEPVAPYCSL